MAFDELPILREICGHLHACGMEVSHTEIKATARRYMKVNQMDYQRALEDLLADAYERYRKYNRKKNK